ncbi:MAG: prohibitin family protein [Pedosphaera sp.]|nr:prohibitin family protein [Pedosphaera sp.]
MNPNAVPRLIGTFVLLFILAVLGSATSYIIDPGTRGIRVTLGKTSDQFLPEGFGFKAPFITTIVPVNIRQKTMPVKVDCFSSDLQQVILEVRVLYRVPEKAVVEIYKRFSGDPFDSLIAPRVQEALKEVTATQTAELIVKNREDIKLKAIEATKKKIGTLLNVEDIVIRNIELSSELERAIEAKMVAEQQAAQARFTQIQTQVEAETVIIRARGEAEAITVRGEALKLNPTFLRLQIVERWNGKSPLVVPVDPNATGAGFLLPLGSIEKSVLP